MFFLIQRVFIPAILLHSAGIGHKHTVSSVAWHVGHGNIRCQQLIFVLEREVNSA